jgi:hypothetical protein
MTPQRAGLKGRNLTAQGNALGLPGFNEFHQ